MANQCQGARLSGLTNKTLLEKSDILARGGKETLTITYWSQGIGAKSSTTLSNLRLPGISVTALLCFQSANVHYWWTISILITRWHRSTSAIVPSSPHGFKRSSRGNVYPRKEFKDSDGISARCTWADGSHRLESFHWNERKRQLTLSSGHL